MKRARGGGEEEGPRQNGSAGRRKGDQQQGTGGDGNPAFDSADLQDDNNPGLRREIRSKYRDLINSVQSEWDGRARRGCWRLPVDGSLTFALPVSFLFFLQRTEKTC